MDEPPQPIRINYFYFGAFLILLIVLAASSIFLKEYYVGSRFFFLLYAIGQAVLEVAGFIFIGWAIERYIGKKTFWTFIGCTFLLAVLHILDFLMDRVLDLSVWGTLGFVLDESFKSFLYLLDASGLPLWLWGILFFLLAMLPFLGMAIYKTADFLSAKRPLFCRKEWLLQTFVCIPVALFIWDLSASPVIHPDAYTAFVKSLPWRFTLVRPKNVQIPLSSSIQSPASEDAVQTALDNFSAQPTKRPNIFLFVIESLREDFITAETAPHLSRFRDQHVRFSNNLSNANGTMLSWFSIFHSQFSIFWNLRKQQNWSMGSPALNLLKKWGYKVRIYTSSQLGYYGMDELILGKGTHLADSYQTFHHAPPIYAAETDAKALQALEKDSKEFQGANISIVFLDATHFDYSWPKEMKAPFVPFGREISYFKPFQSRKNIEHIKNRYKNAIYYIDSILGPCLEKLPDPENTIAVVLGDHGEEFFEHGHLFHNSHIIDEQTRIPLYFKFGSLQGVSDRIASQMDIFPTIIDYLCGQVPPFLEGESLFREVKWPYAFISRFNGGRTPYEFSFHNGRNKVVAQFTNKRNIFSSNALNIRSLRTCRDKSIAECQSTMEAWVEEEFGPAFERLFSSEK